MGHDHMGYFSIKSSVIPGALCSPFISNYCRDIAMRRGALQEKSTQAVK